MAPEFTLKTNEGNQASLKDFRGTWVVLYFYPKDFTSGCTLQARNFQMDRGEVQSSQSRRSRNQCRYRGIAREFLSERRPDFQTAFRH